MADNYAFTPGTGATGAADDIGGVLYPRAKLALGADGSAVDAVAGAGTVGTGVQRITIASDDALLSALPTPCDLITVTPTLDTSVYASGDTLFDKTIINSAVRANDLRALLQSMVVIDKDDQKPVMRIVFLSANVTFGTANAAPSISDTDAANVLGFVDVLATDWVDLGGVSIANIKNIGLMVEAVSGTDDIYFAAYLTSGTPTHTASGLVFRFGFFWS